MRQEDQWEYQYALRTMWDHMGAKERTEKVSEAVAFATIAIAEAYLDGKIGIKQTDDALWALDRAYAHICNLVDQRQKENKE